MTDVALPPPAATGFFIRIVRNPKIELWIVWWAMFAFYQIMFFAYFVLTRVMPPPKPYWTTQRIVEWFVTNHFGIQLGYVLLYLTLGFAGWATALIGYLLSRMSVTPAFGYAYIGVMTVGTLPGALFNAYALTIATWRPDRAPQLIAFLYDFGMATYVGSMGCFFAGSFILTVAILLDRNNILPRWFGYSCIWNLTTEFAVATMWVVHQGPFGWDGSIAFWVNTVVYMFWQTLYIIALFLGIRNLPAGRPARE